VTVRPYHHREQVYHLTGKPLYELIGEPDLRHRRPIPPHRVAQKLMLLDLTIQEPEGQWLATEDEKVRFFLARGLARETLPHRVYLAAGPGVDTTRYFIDRFPIHVDETGRVGLVYPDFSGHEDTFDQFMRDHAALLLALPSAGVIYVTPEGGTAHRAEDVYRRHVGPSGHTDVRLFAEFFSYCQARQRLESDWLSTGERMVTRQRLANAARFRSEVYEGLYKRFNDGQQGEIVSLMVASEGRQVPIRFRHVALPHRYYSLGRAIVPRRAGVSSRASSSPSKEGVS
jgi:hypothetical protein